MAHDHTHHEGAKKLYELIKDIRIAMMTSVEPDGSLHSRPMYSHTTDPSGDLWFFSRARAPKVGELRKDSQINLAYADTSAQTYVSVSGTAEIVTDKGKVKELWSEGLRTWFPNGPEDPDIALIRVHPSGGEYWDSPSRTMMQLYGYAKARLTGETPEELADQKKVSLKA
ncbi:pyridoxamine 5'-phosphate oxidase family protein [Enterovirga sp.]|jgi:general stress protein 26|uniref:pyridoxamine 5'-phosphate oxidase family protein n=1 Tax=Enterovirga sp. TaxID=2026350 RepID=UPI002625AFD5|nr:pyridoxamine 5'-phosphate oxidase family protein [Enterovirga sp.]MDB5589938.1 pyridoxamine 5-phosphate oxidase [Enterovirga sp.]